MTQLVYVHGVSVRNRLNNPDYEADRALRRKAFQEMGFGGGDVTFYDPYWGGYGAPAEYKSIELDGEVWFASAAQEGYAGITAPLSSDELSSTLLRDAAERDFAATLNSLSIVLSDPSNPSCDPELALLLADYLVGLEDVEGVIILPEWMNNPQPSDDADFLERLESVVRSREAESLRLGDAFKQAGRWLLGKGIGFVDGPAARLVRQLTPAVAMFFGDAFIYLKRDDAERRRAGIVKVISDDLCEAALKAQADGDKLIVVGHSMGANILYDMLTDPGIVQPLEDRMQRRLEIDLFLTVGTQVGLLQELGMFGRKGVGPRPEPSIRWWHVCNMMDVLSFGASEVFHDVEQFHVDTNANILDAHNAYFVSPVFQRRLYKRLKAVDLAE